MDTLPVVAGFETLILETVVTPQGARKTTLDAACSRLAAVVAEAVLGTGEAPAWTDPELRRRLLPDASAAADPQIEAKLLAIEFMLSQLSVPKLRSILARARADKCKTGMSKRALLEEVMDVVCEQLLAAPEIEVPRAVAAAWDTDWVDFAALEDAVPVATPAALPLPEEHIPLMDAIERRPKRMRASAAEARLRISSCRRPQRAAKVAATWEVEPEADEDVVPPAKRGPEPQAETIDPLSLIRGLNAVEIESQFKMVDLKEMLRAAGQPVNGRRKAELAERLVACLQSM